MIVISPADMNEFSNGIKGRHISSSFKDAACGAHTNAHSPSTLYSTTPSYGGVTPA